jgi:hypothetical protein
VGFSVAAGTLVDLDFYLGTVVQSGGPGDHFMSQRVPETLHEHFVGSGSEILALYALAPYEAALVAADGTPAAATLTFDNTFGLPAGTQVSVLALGTYIFPDWLPPSQFEPVGTATVSADGAELVMAPQNNRLSVLTWVALRR